MSENKPFAEIIESSLHSWLAQSWRWNQFPTFGSLVNVKTKKREVIGIVYQVQTGSMDPIRYPFAYQKTEEELLREQPQIFEFLKTTFSCLTLGYKQTGKIYYQIAPEPPQIHTFVTELELENYREFLNNSAYLQVLFNFSHLIGNVDELLLALLTTAQTKGCLTNTNFQEFTSSYSMLAGNEYRRLKLFLQRCQHLVR
jgi:hypothetical protein